MLFTSGLRKFIKKLILSILFWCGLVYLTILSIPVYLCRQLVKRLAKNFNPDWNSMLNYRDILTSENLQSEQGLTNMMLLMMVAEGEPSIEKIRTFFRDYILNYKNYKGQAPYSKFQYYQLNNWLGYPFWIRAKGFQLQDHVRILQDFHHGQTNNTTITQEELETFLGDYNMKTFSNIKTPPWELLVVKNFIYDKEDQNGAKKFALVFRWHHSISDGNSIAKIFINIFGGETHHHHYRHNDFLNSVKSNCLSMDYCGQEEEEDEDSLWNNLKLITKNLILLGHDMLKSLKIDQNSWRVSSETLTNKCHLVSTNKLPLNVARTVSKKRRVSVTAVIFSAVCGGVRQYFIETGQEIRIPKVMRIRVCVPMKSNSPCNRLTNHWSFADIELPVEIGEAESRLEKIDEIIEKFRTSLIPSLIWVLGPLLHLIDSLPDCLNILSSLRDTRTTMTGWYFSAPKEALHLFGEYSTLDFLGYIPRGKTDAAISLTIFCYNGTIRYSLCIDKALFSHRESAVKLAKLIEKNFLSLQNLPSISNGNADSHSHQNPFS